jgi:hypothetical protein
MTCPALFLALLLSGCDRGPYTQAQHESAVRDVLGNMKLQTASLTLVWDANGYGGTLTAINGDVYEVRSVPSAAGIETRIVPGRTLIESMTRAELEKKHSSKVKSLELGRGGLSAPMMGLYAGSAELESGAKLKADFTGYSSMTSPSVEATESNQRKLSHSAVWPYSLSMDAGI